MRRLALLGAGGHGKVVADAAQCAGWAQVSFFDDAWPRLGHNGPWEVIGTTDDLVRQLSRFDGVIVSIGACATRMERQRRLAGAGATLATVVHPRATVSRHASLGPGSVVMAGAVIQPGARLGGACIVNTGATVDHDCVLGESVHVGPGAHLAGNVHVGDASWIGIGAVVREGSAIGRDALVGAGAVVVAAVPDGARVVGNPARPMRHPG